jgi:hypothetical protein
MITSAFLPSFTSPGTSLGQPAPPSRAVSHASCTHWETRRRTKFHPSGRGSEQRQSSTACAVWRYRQRQPPRRSHPYWVALATERPIEPAFSQGKFPFARACNLLHVGEQRPLGRWVAASRMLRQVDCTDVDPALLPGLWPFASMRCETHASTIILTQPVPSTTDAMMPVCSRKN